MYHRECNLRCFVITNSFLSFAFKNKAFVYRGQEYEKIGSFNQRLKAQFSDAQVRIDLIVI